MPDATPHRLNLTPERLETATSWLRANAHGLRSVSREARLLAAVGLLICDEAGFIPRPALDSAMADPDAVSAAELLVSAVIR